MSEPKFTKGPWSLCGAERGGCCCFTVGSPHHPIADITHGEWGDEYVNIRLIDNPNGITKLAEAFMDHSWYGEVPDEQARANGDLIAASPEMYEALKLAEHKIDQHLQGQYPDGQALGAALAEIRKALKKTIPKPVKNR